MTGDLAHLAERLGHRFDQPRLLRRALTHASADPRAGERDGPFTYERLEFLGDRVLALIVAEHLLERFPREREGQIARRLVGLVRRETLSEIARGLELGRYLILSKGEDEAGLRQSDSVLADVMEAVIAALYLDGGLEAARRLVIERWHPLVEAEARPPQDAKTALQEWAQGRGLPLPLYELIEQEGPPHAPRFTIRVTVEGCEAGVGHGSSKRIAEQAAAQVLCDRLEPGLLDGGPPGGRLPSPRAARRSSARASRAVGESPAEHGHDDRMDGR